MIETLRAARLLRRRILVFVMAMCWLAGVFPVGAAMAATDPAPANPPIKTLTPSSVPTAKVTPQTPAGAAKVNPKLGTPVTADGEPTTLPDVRKYCTNIANAASEAHVAWQDTKLNELETRLKAKIKELDAKEAELRDWIDKREAIEKKASEKLVEIYAKMRPETAATQLSALDDDMAAAVLGQLTPGKASAIFNEIVPERAAKLAGMIAGTAPSADKKL